MSKDMEAVQAFNQEMSSLYEVKPPISKAKMTAITKEQISVIFFTIFTSNSKMIVSSTLSIKISNC